MQPNNLVKVCPDCSYQNTTNNRNCTNCGRGLAGVRNTPIFQAQSAPSTKPLPSTALPSQSVGQNNSPLNGPLPPVQTTRTPFAKRISNLRTNLRYKKRWVIIVALLLVLLIIFIPVLITHLPHGGTNKGGVPVTPVPTHPQVSQQLPAGLGEGVAANGQYIGVNDGSYPPFDIGRNPQEMSYKQQAAQDLHTGNSQGAVSSWGQALSIESNDAEALIYLEDRRVLTAGNYVTLVAAISFTPPLPDAQYETDLQGVYVAQHEFNAANHGFLLRILIANSGSDVDETNSAAVARQIVQVAQQDKTVVGVIGWLNSSNTINALDTFTHAKLPLISPQASSDYLTGISPYFFRIVSSNKFQAQAAVQLMKDTLHVKNPVVFVDPGDAYSQNLTRDFEGAFVAGGHLPEVNFKTDDTKDFAPLIQGALKAHPEVDAFYFTSASSVDAKLFQGALPTTGTYADLPAVAGDGGYAIQPNGYGRWYFTEYAYHGEQQLPVVTQFANEYTADFDPGPNPQKPLGYYSYSLPNDHSILAYDATSVVLIALQAAYANGNTTLTPQILADALPNIKGDNAFQGVSGQIAFGSDHDPINKAVVILYASKDGHTTLNSIHGCFIKGCP